MGAIDDSGRGRVTWEQLTEPDGAVVLKLTGELDLATVDELEAGTRETIARVRHRLVIDAGELGFADSSAIALWVAWRARVPAVEIRHASPLVRRVIEAMGLAEVLVLP